MMRKPIVTFPDYEIDEDGNIYSQFLVRKRGKKGTEWNIVKPIPRYGYLQVTLSRDRKGYNKRVHNLMLETFVGPRPKGYVCRHFPDANGYNNKLSNLQWGTYKENGEDSIIQGKTTRGTKSHFAKLNEEKVIEIRKMINNDIPFKEIAKIFKISPTTIRDIDKKRSWAWLEYENNNVLA